MMPIHQQHLHLGYPAGFGVYEGRRLPFASLQNLKEVIVNNWKEVTIQVVRKSIAQWKQKLSYRQQIARLLRTQYAAGIYRFKYYTVTLKSRLRVKLTGNGTIG